MHKLRTRVGLWKAQFKAAYVTYSTHEYHTVLKSACSGSMVVWSASLTLLVFWKHETLVYHSYTHKHLLIHLQQRWIESEVPAPRRTTIAYALKTKHNQTRSRAAKSLLTILNTSTEPQRAEPQSQRRRSLVPCRGPNESQASIKASGGHISASS